MEDRDSDSAIFDDGDDGDARSTTSVDSRYRDFPVENERSYHAYDADKYQYLFPNDEPEQKRLDMQHHLFLLTLNGKLCLTPIDGTTKLDRVLDVGTGTGIWAMDFADEHPKATVYGADLSPIQPEWVPPNVMFEIDNVEKDWTYKYLFDFIHCRMMAISLTNWPRFFQQAFNNLRPGGFIEVTDICFPIRCDDGTLPDDSALLQWCDLMRQACEELGRRCNSAKYYEEQMAAVGFINVKRTIFQWPQNTWLQTKKGLGFWTQESMGDLRALEGLTMRPFTRYLLWKREQVTDFVARVREDMLNRGIHAYWDIYVVCGQKPKQ